MENDDRPIGQLLSRRDALKLLGIGRAAFLAACASPRRPARSSQPWGQHWALLLQAQLWTVLSAPK
jgi:hypothetical protein